jgi:CheY-like chemotaxis protein
VKDRLELWCGIHAEKVGRAEGNHLMVFRYPWIDETPEDSKRLQESLVESGGSLGRIDFPERVELKIDVTKGLPDVIETVLTAQAQPERITAAMQAGADDYILKPFDPGDLSAHVRAALRRRSQ